MVHDWEFELPQQSGPLKFDMDINGESTIGVDWDEEISLENFKDIKTYASNSDGKSRFDFALRTL